MKNLAVVIILFSSLVSFNVSSQEREQSATDNISQNSSTIDSTKAPGEDVTKYIKFEKPSKCDGQQSLQYDGNKFSCYTPVKR